MNKARYRLIHINRTKSITRKTIQELLEWDPSLEKIYKLSPKVFSLQFAVPLKKATLFYNNLHNHKLREKVIQDLNSYNIITILDELYPPHLKEIKDPPLVLYTIGDLSLLQSSKMLSVIGTRKPSKEAKYKLNHIVKPLLAENWVILSGMATGVDGYAHLLSLQQHAKTIAVLGSGFQHIYPKEHLSLFNDISKNGLVISEYFPEVRPEKYHFPERNRIISGLSFGTLVIEAMEKSGTLITVEQALDQGREVFAVPGSPLIPQTEGCHRLIQEGAKLTQHANDIREEWISISSQFQTH